MAASDKMASLAARTIHIKTSPMARNFAERREILKVMQRFGEVSMFRSLQFDRQFPRHNAYLCLFKDRDAALSAMRSSPIRFRILNPSEPTTSTAQSSTVKTISSPSETIFELQAHGSKFPHEEFIKRSPNYGPWVPVLQHRSPIATDLDERVPVSPAAPALRDWESDAQMSDGRIEGEALGGSSRKLKGTGGLAGKMATMPWRLRLELMESQQNPETWPEVMRGISQFAKKD